MRLFNTIIVLFIPLLFLGTENRESNLYRIRRIKTFDSLYVIHASRNDSLFLIVSYKDKPEYGNKIMKGHYYDLELVKVFPIRYWNGVPIVTNLRIKKSRMIFAGNVIISPNRRFHQTIYKTESIVGLYYIGNNNKRE